MQHPAISMRRGRILSQCGRIARACLPIGSSRLWHAGIMSRTAVLTDARRERIGPLMTISDGSRGRPFRYHRLIVEGLITFPGGNSLARPAGELRPVADSVERHRRFSGDGTWDKIHSRILAKADAAVGKSPWIPRSTGPTSTPRTFPATQGDLSNYMNLLEEPPDHGIGRSRGGLTTKIHHRCDGRMRWLVMLLGDSAMFPHLLDSLSVLRLGPGRARSRPVRALADKAYSSKANRELLRRRGIQADPGTLRSGSEPQTPR